MAVWITWLLFSWIATYNTFDFIIGGTKTTWIITQVRTNDNDGITYSVTAKYDCGWNIIEWESYWSSSAYNYSVGEEITLYCDTSNPRTFVPKTSINYILVLFPLMWVFIVVLWIKKVLESAKRKKLKQELMQFGTKIEAIITNIAPTWAEVNHQPWYRITAQYGEDIFVSEEIFADIYKILKQWDKIDVYMDYGDHSRYLMDTDSIFERTYDNTTIIEKVFKNLTNK